MQIILPQQILIPKKVYIGDTAELRCSFNTPNTQISNLVAEGAVELPLLNQTDIEESQFAIPHKDYEIKKITLSSAGVDYYQFTITFVPWKTGELKLPPMEIEGTGLILELQPVQIVSLVSTDSSSTTTLKDSAAPLLLPGTAYKLYGSLAAFVIFLIILIRIIVKRKSLLFYINTRRLLSKYKKNKKQTLKQLKSIAGSAKENTKNSSRDNAEKIQKIIRNYLEIRFDYPFTHSVTSEMMKGWQLSTSGLLSDAKEEAFGDIAASFVRMDYIRYSKNGRFTEGELLQLVSMLSDRIEILEKEDKPEGEQNAQL